MSQTSKIVLIAIVAALTSGGGVFLWQSGETQESPPVSTQELNEPETITESTNTNEFTGVVEYNCEKSSGSFSNNVCVCPSEEEMQEINKYNCENTDTCLSEDEVRDLAYDKTTGFCQTTYGGPGGDAFAASIGLPYGDYGFFMDIIVNSCGKSGGEMSGAACICSNNMTYDKTTGYCK